VLPDHWKHTCVASQQLTPLFTGAHQLWQSLSVWQGLPHWAVLPESGEPPLDELELDEELEPDDPELLLVDASTSGVLPLEEAGFDEEQP
jgi:hypothetical protein